MIFLRQIVLLSLISWSLILPSRIRANVATPLRAPYRSRRSSGDRTTKTGCEKDRTNYINDPIIGARMKAAGS
jgi:hypothetical protein